MGIAERKEKQKLEIRKMILDASMKLFVEEGFDQVTIRKIADLIEYSPTTVYLYFKDKNEIFYQLHELGFQKMAISSQSIAGIENPLLRLHKMGEHYIDFGLANPEYYDVMFIQRAPMQVLEKMDNCDWKHGETAMNFLRTTIQDCMEKGYIKKGNADVVSMGIWGMVHGLVSLAIRQRFDKLCPEGRDEYNGAEIKDMMHESLNWLVNSIDQKS
ncbi:TetR/AcrR family transcriptional regulator [Panacibacter sp. DH6]|uniref:TetR/AcrR family transcriptional regulator n=1 Tax=Panacibacter microcysteis TaxID=2793269 RepID=A0A931GTK9_9BACT|nr:TetR/AcrR family transcriptional regulator [Panacibacter microcysteis]MBG9375671.1 TetR/AcrR family transcriptional regulator [Panacibacter microcysteis]